MSQYWNRHQGRDGRFKHTRSCTWTTMHSSRELKQWGIIQLTQRSELVVHIAFRIFMNIVNDVIRELHYCIYDFRTYSTKVYTRIKYALFFPWGEEVHKVCSISVWLILITLQFEVGQVFLSFTSTLRTCSVLTLHSLQLFDFPDKLIFPTNFSTWSSHCLRL